MDAPRSASAVLEPPVIDTGDIAALERAFEGGVDTGRAAAASYKEAHLTISRHDADDFQDRQIYLFVDGEAWGKIRYGQSLTREMTPGRHSVRAFNTLFSRTLDLDVQPAEHVRLRCGNGFPKAGWLVFIFLHVTYLLVRLERESPTE